VESHRVVTDDLELNGMQVNGVIVSFSSSRISVVTSRGFASIPSSLKVFPVRRLGSILHPYIYRRVASRLCYLWLPVNLT